MQVIPTTAATPLTDTTAHTPTIQNHPFSTTLSLYACLYLHTSPFLLISSPPYILCVGHYVIGIVSQVQSQLYRPCAHYPGYLPLENCRVLYLYARISLFKLLQYAVPSKLPTLTLILVIASFYTLQIHPLDLVPEDP